jgi:2-methylcitrate dehydratase PrpD
VPLSLVADRLTDWVTDLRFDDLPSEVVERTKLLVLDQLGVALLGATLPHVQPVLRLVDQQGHGGTSTLIHSGRRTSASLAAYANGTLGHSCEFDDAHALAWHTASAVVPAVLALAEAEDRTGPEVITAVAAGVQVMSLLGAVATGGMLTAGWHGSRVLGVFGATAAAGHILGLTSDQLTDAFGIAGSDAGGTMEYDRSGGEVKRLHAGSAARAGVEAAQLARLGLTGPHTIFEGPRGLFRLFGGTDDIGALDAAWDRWHVLDTIFRFYPAVGTVHAPLDAIRHLRDTHDIDPAEIDEIRVGLAEFAVGHGASITRPADAISAQFSLAFGVGLQFVTGHNAPADYFDPARWVDPAILAIGDRIKPYPMPIPDGDPAFSALVEIVLRDGTVLRHYQSGFLGHPSRPATADDIEAKFRAGVRETPLAHRVDDLLAAVHSLDVRAITRIMRRG